MPRGLLSLKPALLSTLTEFAQLGRRGEGGGDVRLGARLLCGERELRRLRLYLRACVSGCAHRYQEQRSHSPVVCVKGAHACAGERKLMTAAGARVFAFEQGGPSLHHGVFSG